MDLAASIRPSLRLLLGVLFTLLLITVSAFAQRRACRIGIIVVLERNELEKVRDATVELGDAMGNSSETERKQTDSDGRVEFQSFTGVHRIRISGSEILTLEGEVEVTPSETYHVQMVRVRPKPQPGEAKAPEGKATVSSAGLSASPRAQKQFERGSKALEAKRWQESRQLFESAIAISPGYDLAYNGLGVACTNLNDTEAARAAFAKAIELNPKFATAQRNLARILLAEKNYAEADTLLTQSLVVEPANVWAITSAAYAELQLKQYKEAAARARRVHQFPHESFAEAHMVAGYALEALGQTAEAKAEFQLYLKEEPTGANAQRAQEAITRVSAVR